MDLKSSFARGEVSPRAEEPGERKPAPRSLPTAEQAPPQAKTKPDGPAVRAGTRPPTDLRPPDEPQAPGAAQVPPNEQLVRPARPVRSASAILSAVQVATEEPSEDQTTKRILIAEDDTVSLRLLEATVRRWGYAPICVNDGASALAKLSAPDGPRMAILDWEMPGLSGPQVCRILRARNSGPYVYLIVLTGRAAKEHLFAGLSSGADDYVLKPFDPAELQLRVRTGQRIVDLQHELLEARRELERRANHDALTGAANRGAILAKVEEEAARSERQKTHYCLILFDLDFFKRINDTHGHRAGDLVLQEAVRRAERELRPYDRIGRYGGEEFMVLLPGCELEEGATVAERLRLGLCDKPVDVEKASLTVTASFGLVCSSQPHDSLEALVDAADSALYRAKGAGRNQVRVAGEAERDSTSAALGRRASVAASRMSFSLSLGADEEPSAAGTGPMSPVFDRSVLAQVQDLVEDGSDFLQELFAKYVLNADTTIRTLESEERDDKKRRAVHSLRGASLSIGATGVADACRRVERALRTDVEAKFEPLVEMLQLQVERVRDRYPLEIERMTSRRGE